jgi:glycosyltransferase involved in cell wall biosynthesis
LGISPDEFLIGCLGRGTPEKGHRYLLEALVAAPARGDSSKILMIGVPPPGDRPALYPHVAELHRMARELGLNSRVEFLGFQAEAHRWLNALDLLVQPSLRESFGLAAVEAMATGLPVIASRVGGLAEVIVDGETGLLVPPADPDALGAAISRLRNDPGLRSSMGQRGRLRAQRHFSHDLCLRQMEQVYELALGRMSASGSTQRQDAPSQTAGRNAGWLRQP